MKQKLKKKYLLDSYNIAS